MITAREISYSLFGAWRLAHLDPRGMQYFDTSIEGFWRSFWAAALMAPLYALLLLLQLSEREAGWDPLRVAVVETIGYTMVWSLFPLAAWYLLSALGKQDRYIAYIVAYNWAKLAEMALMLPIGALEAADALPGPLTGFIIIAAFAAMLYYEYFIARTALEVDAPVAIGLVLMDFILGVLRQSIVVSLEFR